MTSEASTASVNTVDRLAQRYSQRVGEQPVLALLPEVKGVVAVRCPVGYPTRSSDISQRRLSPPALPNNKDTNNYQKRKCNLGGERAATLRLYNHHSLVCTQLVAQRWPHLSTPAVAPATSPQKGVKRVPVALWGLVCASRVKCMTLVSSPITPPSSRRSSGLTQGA